jgi:CMP-N,N'-diacetyllegionaminic acid synthase
MINGAIFLNRRESLLRDRTFEPASAYPYVMPADRSLQIDTPWDWFLVEKVMDTYRGE